MATITTSDTTNSESYIITFDRGQGRQAASNQGSIQMLGKAVAILQNFSETGESNKYQYTSEIMLKYSSKSVINAVIKCSSGVDNDYDIKELSLSSKLKLYWFV